MTTLDKNIGDRTTGLGGSDMAAILGVDRWRTPLDVYLEKTGEVEGFSGNEITDLGSRFERSVADIYADRTGFLLTFPEQEFRHPDHPWAMAHLDAAVDGPGARIVEIKCSSAHDWGQEGTDEIPAHYLPQVHHYMGITGADCCDVAALLWGNHGPPTVRIYTVPRDDEMVGILLEEGSRFWSEHVEARIPPDPATEDDANKLWAHAATGTALEADEEIVHWLGRLERLKAQIKEAKEAESAIKLRLKEAFRFATDDGTFLSAESLTHEGKAIATWKEHRRRSFDAKAFREAHPELAAEFTRETTYRAMRTTAEGKRIASTIED